MSRERQTCLHQIAAQFINAYHKPFLRSLSASLRISPLPINSISPIQPNHLICVTDMNTPTAFLQTEIRLHENIFSLSLSFILSLSFFLFSFISCQLFPEISFQFFSLSIFWLVNEFLFLRKRSCHRCVLSK